MPLPSDERTRLPDAGASTGCVGACRPRLVVLIVVSRLKILINQVVATLHLAWVLLMYIPYIMIFMRVLRDIRIISTCYTRLEIIYG